MSVSLKVITPSPILWAPFLTFTDTRESSGPAVLTYATYDLYNADSRGAKVLLLSLDGRYRLRKPIAVTLKGKHDDEYIASFEDAMLSRSGETAGEALEWLKSSISTLYKVLGRQNPKKLGPLPKRQLKVLGEYLVAKSDPKT